MLGCFSSYPLFIQGTFAEGDAPPFMNMLLVVTPAQYNQSDLLASEQLHWSSWGFRVCSLST